MIVSLQKTIRQFYSTDTRRGTLQQGPYRNWTSSKVHPKEDTSSFLDSSDMNKKESLTFYRPPVLNFPRLGKLAVSHILSQLEYGELQHSDFRNFLDDLESTPLENYASQICGELFRVIKKNLHTPDDKHEEIVALGCVIRKLVFNFSETELSRVAELLNQVKDYRYENNSTIVEKLINKALVDRFESYPIARSELMVPIVDALCETITCFNSDINTKTTVTKVTLLDAILGFACFASEQRLRECSFDFKLPKSLSLLLYSMGKDIQGAINHKILEENLRPKVLPFLERLIKN